MFSLISRLVGRLVDRRAVGLHKIIRFSVEIAAELNEFFCKRNIKDEKQLVVTYHMNHNERIQLAKNRTDLII
jgi:hypothetical protein